MSNVMTIAATPPLTLHFGSVLQKLSDEEFFEFCQWNREWRIERTSAGDLIIMPPTGGKTGNRNFTLIVLFGQWVVADGTGKGFDSSTGFILPNGAERSPDLAWVSLERWNTLTEEQREKFPPICPDFVVELRSRTDALSSLQEKMQEYIDNGAQLGWLIDAYERKVYLYRPQRDVEVLDDPATVSGEPVLRGFTLDVQALWQ